MYFLSACLTGISRADVYNKVVYLNVWQEKALKILHANALFLSAIMGSCVQFKAWKADLQEKMIRWVMWLHR